MAGKDRSNERYLAKLLALPWQTNLLLAVVILLINWLIKATFSTPILHMTAVLFAILTIPVSLLFLFSAAFSISKNRNNAPSVSSINSHQNTARPSEAHRVVYGWTRDGKSLGYSSIQSKSAAATIAYRPDAWSIDLLQQIEWKLFEDLSAAFYKEKGIRAELTKLGADGGIDIKLYQDASGNPTSLVQCKAWKVKNVGVREIREFLGVMCHEKISKGFYMTSGIYSVDAKEFAKSNSITLIDGVMLISMIRRLPVAAQQRLLGLATEGDYTTPSCPSCGVKMLKRISKRGEFWGCRNYPKCRNKLF